MCHQSNVSHVNQLLQQVWTDIKNSMWSLCLKQECRWTHSIDDFITCPPQLLYIYIIRFLDPQEDKRTQMLENLHLTLTPVRITLIYNKQ